MTHIHLNSLKNVNLMIKVIVIFSEKLKLFPPLPIVIKHIHNNPCNTQNMRYMSKFINLFKPKTYENLSPFKRGCNVLYYSSSAIRDVQLR